MGRPRKQLTNEEYLTLRQQFSAPEENYKLLGSGHPVFGRRNIWDGDYTREQYLRSVDHLIGVLDGTIDHREAVAAGADRQIARPDVVVWLDKSARPCSWFVDAFWDQIAAPHASKPRYEFLRIDRRDWLPHMGYTDVEARNAVPKDVCLDDVPKELILRIRSLFGVETLDLSRWSEQLADAATTLDDQHVVVVDETHVSGATLAIATGLLSRVAPRAYVSGTYFWRDTTAKQVGGVYQPGTVPIWYPGEQSDGTELTVFGRGIGNSSADYWNHQPDSDLVYRKRLAAAYVSAPHHDPVTYAHLRDELAEDLAEDIKQLARDYASGRVLRRPSHHRPDDDFDHIIADQGLAFEDFVALNDRHSTEITRRVKDLC